MTLNGKRILITRSAEQAQTLCNALVGLGAEPVVVPTIEIVPPQSYTELDQTISDIDQFDYLILTSVNAVHSFCRRLNTLGYDADALNHMQIVAVGPKSADALAALGFKADMIPDDYRAEGVVKLLRHKVAGKHILYPKAALARDLIPIHLREAGAEIVAPVAYSSAAPAQAAERLKAVLNEGLDMLTFTASSTVDNFVKLLDPKNLESARQIPVASIGPLTTKTARTHGFNVVVEPENSTLDEMVEAIARYFAQS